MTFLKRGQMAIDMENRLSEVERELKSYSLSDWERERYQEEQRDLERDLKALGY